MNDRAETSSAGYGQPVSAGRLPPEVKAVATVVIVGAIMSILDTTIVNVAINTLSRDFHTSLATIQ